MFIFKSDSDGDGIAYDEKYFADLGKKLAEESIANLRKELKEMADEEENVGIILNIPEISISKQF